MPGGVIVSPHMSMEISFHDRTHPSGNLPRPAGTGLAYQRCLVFRLQGEMIGRKVVVPDSH